MLSSPKLKKSLYKNLGESMVFFTLYESTVKAIREQATQRLVATGGGPLGLTSVSRIVIETSTSADNWKKLLASGISGDTRIELSDGSRNRIKSVILDVNKAPRTKELLFGKAVFTLDHLA